MTSADLKLEFLGIIGNAYTQYGYPEYCGWIEGLLLAEPREWTQVGISERLGELFPAQILYKRDGKKFKTNPL